MMAVEMKMARGKFFWGLSTSFAWAAGISMPA